MFEFGNSEFSEQALEDLCEFIAASGCQSIDVLSDALERSIGEIEIELPKQALGTHEFYSCTYDRCLENTLLICMRAAISASGSITIHKIEMEWNPDDPPPVSNAFVSLDRNKTEGILLSFHMYSINPNLPGDSGITVMVSELTEGGITMTLYGNAIEAAKTLDEKNISTLWSRTTHLDETTSFKEKYNLGNGLLTNVGKIKIFERNGVVRKENRIGTNRSAYVLGQEPLYSKQSNERLIPMERIVDKTDSDMSKFNEHTNDATLSGSQARLVVVHSPGSIRPRSQARGLFSEPKPHIFRMQDAAQGKSLAWVSPN